MISETLCGIISLQEVGRHLPRKQGSDSGWVKKDGSNWVATGTAIQMAPNVSAHIRSGPYENSAKSRLERNSPPTSNHSDPIAT